MCRFRDERRDSRELGGGYVVSSLVFPEEPAGGVVESFGGFWIRCSGRLCGGWLIPMSSS